MPQDSLRSVVYRSFVTCDDPKGVAECKTIRKSKQKSKNASSTSRDEEREGKASSASKEELQNLSRFQVMEVSRGAARLNEVIDSRPSKHIATDLLRGALHLQESLVMLGKLQEASNFIANSTNSHKEKMPLDLGNGFKNVDSFKDEPRISASRDCCDEFRNVKSFKDDCDEPRVSTSRDCYDELRDVIRESFARQNLLPKVSGEERVGDVDLPSSSSSQTSSSLIYSHSSGCSPASFRHEKMKGSNLIAKLMGLEEVPANGAVFKERVPYRRSPLLDIDLPRPKKPQFMVEKVVRERRTLEEIIDTMQFKGILGRKSVDGSNDCKFHSNALFMRKDLAADTPPIVIMRPLRGRDVLDQERHDNHSINGGKHFKSKQMVRKMREEFPPRPKPKAKEPNEKSAAERSSKQKLDRSKEGKNSEKVGMRADWAVKKAALDSQERLSSTKMNQSKPLLPQMQKKAAVVQKIENIPKVAPNKRKAAETRDAKPQRSDKTQDLAKLASLKHSRTVRGNNVSKNQIARGKVAAVDKSTKATSLDRAVPKKNPRKGESNSKPSSASVENTQSDGNFAINIESIISEPLVKNTEPEQTTEEVVKDYYMSDNSTNAASSPSEASGLITKDDSNHIGDETCIPSFDSDQFKGCKNIMNSRYLLLSSVSFLNHIEELFDTGTHDSMAFQTACLPDSEVIFDSLLFDCAKEILEHKSLSCRSMRNLWSQNLSRRQKHHLSMEQLVGEISDNIEDLQKYSKSCGDIVVADSIYPMLDRDLRWNEEVTGAWGSGWRKGYTMEAADEVMHDVEELVLSEIVADVIIEIMQ